jgi:hypothetical protein
MAPMKRSVLALLFAVALTLGACTTTQSASVQQESEACYRPRSFTEEIPQMYWGDPVRDPCWRFRAHRARSLTSAAAGSGCEQRDPSGIPPSTERRLVA